MKYTKKFAKKIDFVSPVWLDLKSILIGKDNVRVNVKNLQKTKESHL